MFSLYCYLNIAFSSSILTSQPNSDVLRIEIFSIEILSILSIVPSQSLNMREKRNQIIQKKDGREITIEKN